MALALTLEITADTRDAERGLDRVERGVQALGDKAKAADARLDASFSQLDKNLKKLEATQTKTTEATSKASAVQTTLTNAIVRYAGPTALLAAATATMHYAGKITDMAAKTGMSVEAIQKLSGAAQDVGVSLEQISTAVGQMSNRLASGDKSTLAALKQMGLQFDDIRRSAPDEAFLKIAGAVGRIPDPMTRTQIAMDLFGRSGLALLPALNKEFVDAADAAVVMSTQTAAALDKTEDSISRMLRSGRVLLAEVLAPMAPALEGIARAASNVSNTVSKSPGFWNKLFGMGGTMMGLGGTVNLRNSIYAANENVAGRAQTIPLAIGEGATLGLTPDQSLDILTGQVLQNTDGLKVLKGATARAATSLYRMADAVLQDVDIFDGARNGGVSAFQRLPFVPPHLLMNTAILGGQANPWGGVGMLAPAGGSANFSSLTRQGFNWGGLGLAGLNTAMPYLAQLVTGGSRGGQIGGSIGGGLGGGIGSLFTGASGIMGTLSGFLGPIGGILGGLIGKLFGPSQGAILGKEADARIGNTQAGLLQQFGSVENIAGMGPAGAALAAAWGSKNVQGEQWFNKLNDALQQQLSLQEQIKSVEEQRKALVESLVPTWEQLVTAASRYGFDLNELGDKVQQLGSTETFKAILEDLDLFGRATDDVGAYLSRMSGQISVAVQQALRFGTEVPENMKPFIMNLLETGQLLDENGNAITDLSALKWGPAIQTQADIVREAIESLNETFDKLTQKLEDLFDALAHGLPDAAARGAAGANTAFGQIEPVVPGGDRGVEGFASGSGGIRDFGRGTLAVLHGREAVLTERQLRGITGGVSVTINVAGYLDSQIARSHLASVVSAEIGRELRSRRRAA